MKNAVERCPPSDATLGECATIHHAGDDEGFSVAGILARTIANRPPNEDRLRGIV